MFREWSGSAHARASSSESFLAARRAAGDDATCLRCHQPLAEYADAREPAVAEGVTCDVCHNIKSVSMADNKDATHLRLEVDDNIKYGPRCDAKGHYFHQMGCSPLHKTAKICGACHDWDRTLPGGDLLPVFTTYRDWKTGPYQDAMQCQGCHMPGHDKPIAIAEGEKERTEVPHHGQLGADGDLRKRAARLSVRISTSGDILRVRTTTKNRGAGHMIPSGLPARRLAVRSSVVVGGATISLSEKQYGRVLVDGAGKPAAFFRATRVAADTRIAPGESRSSTFELNAPVEGELVVELLWRALDPEIAAALGAKPGDEVLASLRLPFGPSDSGARRGLPEKAVAP